MKVVLKVIRCNINKFRLGYHLPKFAKINILGIKSIDVVGVASHTLHINNTNWYINYGTIESEEVGRWIINNHWDRQPRTPIQLLLFELMINNGKHVLTYVRPSKFKKKPNNNQFTTDNGVNYETIPIKTNAIDFLWK